jgi:uncharacterized protein (DUF1800 family)
MNSTAIALNRFGLGARPDEAPPADPHRWLLEQFARYQPQSSAWEGLGGTDALLAGYQAQQRELRAVPQEQRPAMRQKLRRGARQSYQDAVHSRLASAIDTPTPFVERLVHFWSNHFAVSVEKPVVLDLAGAYEAEAIRAHVLGRFEDLLVAAVRHPAMLVYLDQAQSVGPGSLAARRAARRDPERARGLNENLAREIMELHTLGVRSGYTQQDVTEFARALTGWSLGNHEAGQMAGGGFQYRPALHEPGPRSVLGRSYPEGGQEQALTILRDLAVSPATARHIATKLARHFCADDPPPALVQRLVAAYQRSGGDLPAIYRALVESPETWAATALKFKTPWEWSVSSMRALGRHELKGAQAAGLLNQLGQPVWRPGSPAGYDDIAASWAAPEALVRRVEVAQRLAAQAGNSVDARALAPRLLPGDALAPGTAEAIARSESGSGALALLLVSPDFLRR